MKKQYLLIPVVALLAAGTLAGCGQQQTPPPDVSTVAKAVAVANANGKLINSGTIVGDYGAETWFQKGEGWVHLLNKSWGEENYYVAYGTGEKNAWSLMYDSDEGGWYLYETVKTQAAQGYAFSATNLIGVYETIYNDDGSVWDEDGTAFFYGTEALVSGLFAAAGDNVTTSIADGVYSFDFVVAAEKEDGAETAPVYQVEVDFTLGASYTFNKVNVKSSVWYVADGQVPADTDATYAYTYEIEQVAGESFENDYNPAELLVTDYTIVDANEQAVADGSTVTVDKGVALELGVNVTPTTADLAWNNIDVKLVDEETQTTYKKGDMLWGWGKAIEYRLYEGKLNFKVETVGEYTVTVTIAGKATKFTMDVIDPPVREVYATVDYEKATETNAYLGNEVMFGVEVNTGAELNVEITSVSVPTGSAITKDNVVYSSVYGAYTFTPDVAGEYVITITSLSETNVEGLEPGTLTVVVSEPPSAASLLSGTWTGVDSRDEPVSLVITPDATPASGAELSGSAVLTYMGYSWSGSYEAVENITWTYTAAEGVLATTDGSYVFGLTENYTIEFGNAYQNKVYSVQGELTTQTGASTPSTAKTLTVTDNAGFGISGTYTYEIGDDNAITVKDGDGNDVTNFTFTVMPGNVIAVQFSSSPMTQTLYTDTEGVTAATAYAGTLYVLSGADVAITFVFA